MRIATVVGIVLIGLGMVSLAFSISPVGFLIQATLNQQKMDLVPPILGGIALVSGIALVLVVRPKAE